MSPHQTIRINAVCNVISFSILRKLCVTYFYGKKVPIYYPTIQWLPFLALYLEKSRALSSDKASLPHFWC